MPHRWGEGHGSVELRAARTHSKYAAYPYVAILALGLQRPAGFCALAEPGFEEPDATRIGQLECGKLFSTLMSEYTSNQRSGEETINTGPYGDLPLLYPFSARPLKSAQAEYELASSVGARK